jgi:hypothetical protein
MARPPVDDNFKPSDDEPPIIYVDRVEFSAGGNDGVILQLVQESKDPGGEKRDKG